ncbi:MAG: hypothetical protein ACR2PK_13640 [Acidimicrobiales bacterium]
MRVFIHIGHYKCGTTALQRRLVSQRSALADQGILYPKIDHLRDGRRPLPNHSTLAFELLRERSMPIPPWYRQRRADLIQTPSVELMRERMAVILGDAADRGADIILSSEEFMRFGDGAKSEGLVEELLAILPGTDVVAFAHLRRPDAHMPSFYNQLVKLGSVATNLSNNLNDCLRPIHVEYNTALRPWVKALGPDRVIVRRYEDREADITDDFLAAVGLDVELAPDSERWENERFPDMYVETLRRWNQLRAPQELTDRVMGAARMLATGRHADVKVDLLTNPARTELHQRFEGIDADLTDLLGRDSSLFPDRDEILIRDDKAMTDQQAHLEFGTELLEAALLEDVTESSGSDSPAPLAASKPSATKPLISTVKRWLR